MCGSCRLDDVCELKAHSNEDKLMRYDFHIVYLKLRIMKCACIRSTFPEHDLDISHSSKHAGTGRNKKYAMQILTQFFMFYS